MSTCSTSTVSARSAPRTSPRLPWLARSETVLVLQVGGVHVLCAVRDEVHHGHQHHEIGKALPVSEYRSAVTRPIRARTVPSFGLFHFCADKKRKQRRQSADKKQRAPPPVRINKAVRPGCEQESQRIAFLQ